MAEKPRIIGLQDTGNPVLDSVVNIVCCTGFIASAEQMKNLHNAVLEIAMKEPGGLKARRETDLVQTN